MTRLELPAERGKEELMNMARPRPICVIAALMLVVCTSAFADCPYGGRTVPEGTVIPGFVCSGGKWVPR